MSSEAQNIESFSSPELETAKLTLKWFNGSKGFGFVVPEDNSYDAFIHITTLQEVGLHSVGEGAELMCTIYDGDKGKQVKDIVEVISKGMPSTIPVEDPEAGTVTMGGIVKWFKPDKGFGFIIADDGAKDVFIHQTCLERLEIEELRPGQRVKMTLKEVDKGREAVHVEVIDAA